MTRQDVAYGGVARRPPGLPNGRGGNPGLAWRNVGDLEVRLDQCWDLLRQRRARTEFGANPDGAAVRAPGDVKGYEG